MGKRQAKGQSLEEAVNIAASLRKLRPKVLGALLSHCTGMELVKLVRDLGEASAFPWGKNPQWHVDRLGPAAAGRAAARTVPASPSKPDRGSAVKTEHHERPVPEYRSSHAGDCA